MTNFQAPLTSLSHPEAAYGVVRQSRYLDLQSQAIDGTILASIDLSGYTSVTTGDVQQGLQWEIVLSSSSPLSRSTSSNASKLRNLALRRKSSIGGAKAIERLTQAHTPDSPSSSVAASPSSTSTTSSSKSWLKSKLRSKSISASQNAALASLAMSPSVTSQQPLPADATVLIAKNNNNKNHVSATLIEQPARPSTAEGSSITKTTKAPTSPSLPPLVLSTISKELQLKWIDALSTAIATCAQEARVARASSASTSGMPSSSSLPSLAIHSSPSNELSNYAFPRRASPSPLRMTTMTKEAIPASSPIASPTTSFLEIGPSSSSRPSTASSQRTPDDYSGSRRTALPIPGIMAASRRTSGSPNPLLPQWLSDVRRNSSGSFVLDERNRPASRSSSPSPAISPATSPLLSPTSRMPSVVVERPTIRQSKSSSFLNLDPTREVLVPSSPYISHHRQQDSFPERRGIKISIHPDEEDEAVAAQIARAAQGLYVSQSGYNSRRASPTPSETERGRASSPIPRKHPLSSSTASPRNLGIDFGRAKANSNHSTDHLLRIGQNDTFLRPSLSSASLASSNGASSMYGGGESISSLAQSTDPPTPCPTSVEILGTPQSCELTPACVAEGHSKTKLQGYFGVPREIVESPPQMVRLPSSTSIEPTKQEKKQKETDHQGTPTAKLPLHARIGNVFAGSSNNSSNAHSRSTRSSEDKESIKSIGSMSTSSISASTSSITSPVSTHIDSVTTSRKSSYDLPGERKPDVGRHIIDPAELRRLMQERLDSSTSSSPGQGRLARRPAAAISGGMKKSASLQAALDSYARTSSSRDRNGGRERENLSASTNISPDAIEYHKYTFGKAHPAQVPPTPSFSPPLDEKASFLHSHTPAGKDPLQQIRMMPRSGSANNVAVQALFAALPPPKRRSAGPKRPSTSGDAMPTVQEAPFASS